MVRAEAAAERECFWEHRSDRVRLCVCVRVVERSCVRPGSEAASCEDAFKNCLVSKELKKSLSADT